MRTVVQEQQFQVQLHIKVVAEALLVVRLVMVEVWVDLGLRGALEMA